IIQLEANGDVMKNGCTTPNFLPGFNLECYPNQDSTKYIDSFQLDTVHTIFRGTLRYKVNYKERKNTKDKIEYVV
ncbi:unnamed protein product, partial [Rotaria sp. Silwood1]